VTLALGSHRYAASVAPELQLLSGAWTEEPGLDTALSKLILNRVSSGEMPATMRLYVPAREVAFGRRDAVTPQYPAAVSAARTAGFTAVERHAGGRAAVFTEHTIAFALAIPDDDPRATIHRRFQDMSELIVAAFARLGVASAIGEIPGEYCTGNFSVHHDHRLKLMGVGQRLAKHAAHVGGVIAVSRTDLLLRALIPVYRALQLEWRPTTTGSLADIHDPMTNDEVTAALKAELRRRYDVTKGRIGKDLVDEARSRAHRHLPVELG
jgi:octanoyl-[GcvH]:protein N-octanoyltransferase